MRKSPSSGLSKAAIAPWSTARRRSTGNRRAGRKYTRSCSARSLPPRWRGRRASIYGAPKTSHIRIRTRLPQTTKRPGGNMRVRCRRVILGLFIALAMQLSPAFTAEAYKPDPKLVEAARKEGQVLWYTTLIVDQIVRPLIKQFQLQVPGIDVKFIRVDSGQQVTRLINEASVNRTQADVWNVIDGATPLAQKNIAAQFDIASAKGLPPTLVDVNRRWIATN